MSNIISEEGIKRTEQGVFCSKCNSDLSQKNSTRFMLHADGMTSFTYWHQCVKCGNIIKQTIARSKEDLEWWTDDDEETAGE